MNSDYGTVGTSRESSSGQSVRRRRRRLDSDSHRRRIDAVKRAIRSHGWSTSPTTRGCGLASQTSIVAATSSAVRQRVDALYDFFDLVVVINLESRRDRWQRFLHQLSDVDWPFKRPMRLSAVDGRLVEAPRWWRAGEGAWGCHQSHLRAIEMALMWEVESILVLEDDVRFVPDFCGRVRRFLSHVPHGWDQLYLGGQHLLQDVQAPAQVNAEILRPFNVNRTHAYALSRRFLRPVYRHLTDYGEHARRPDLHVDHRLGELHQTGEYAVYAPTRWLTGQLGGYSDVKSDLVPDRIWNDHDIQRGRD